MPEEYINMEQLAKEEKIEKYKKPTFKERFSNLKGKARGVSKYIETRKNEFQERRLEGLKAKSARLNIQAQIAQKKARIARSNSRAQSFGGKVATRFERQSRQSSPNIFGGGGGYTPGGFNPIYHSTGNKNPFTITRTPTIRRKRKR